MSQLQNPTHTFRRRRQLVLLACSAGLSLLGMTPSQAAEQYFQSTVKSVYPLSTGDFVVLFNAASPQCANTNSPQYFYVSVGKNAVTLDGANKLYAAALVAMTGGYTFAIAFDDATPQCYVNRGSIQ